MPPRTRKPRAAEGGEQVEAPAPRQRAEAAICAACWPEGWPAEQTFAVCDHGRYSRR